MSHLADMKRHWETELERMEGIITVLRARMREQNGGEVDKAAEAEWDQTLA